MATHWIPLLPAFVIVIIKAIVVIVITRVSCSFIRAFQVLKNPLANAGDIKRHGFNPWIGKIPWRRK